MRLNELLAGFVDIKNTREITAISTSSKNLTMNTLWLAPRGLTSHALDYFSKDLEYAAIIYEPPFQNPPLDAIPLPNLSMYLGEIANRFYNSPSKKMNIFGVTGTDGKSSLVYFLAQCLPNTAMLGTIGYGRLNQLENASHTTPEALTVQKLLANFQADGVENVSMEVSSHSLHQGRVNGVSFTVGIFTNLTHEHLDYHRSMEEYFAAKALLFAKPLRFAVINIDSEYGLRLIQKLNPQTQLITVSSQNNAISNSWTHFSASEIELLPHGLRFKLSLKTPTITQSAIVNSRLIARFNVDNLLNVAACLLTQEIDFSEIVKKLESLSGVVGRAQSIRLDNGAAAIVDYAHTPAALENILRGIRGHVRGKLWCVFGCGGDRDPMKRPLMGAVAMKFADEVVITDDNPRTEDPQQIIKDINQPNALTIQPREAAISYVLAQLQSNDAVVIAGKGHEDYQIIGTTKHHYSDFETVKKFTRHVSACELANVCGGDFNGEDFDILSVSIDTRTLKIGDVFFALSGKNVNGEEFLLQAKEKGALAAVVSRRLDFDFPQIVVKDVLQALTKLGELKREKSAATFIGITGSNGKTTTKEMIAYLLQKIGKTHATGGNFNNEIGVPLTLANLRGDERFAVIEMGANHVGEIATLCKLVRPKIGVISSISAAHLEGFGSLENVISTKEALFDAAEKVVINVDAPTDWVKKYSSKAIAFFSLNSSSDDKTLTATNISDSGDEFSFKGVQVKWKLLGKHNVSNALAALAVANECGLNYEAGARELIDFHVKNSRFNVYKIGIHTIIDDTYNANPASFAAALHTLASLIGEKTAFAGAMFELGNSAEKLHGEIKELANELKINFVAVNTDFYGIKSLSKIEAVEKFQTLLQKSTPQNILVKGSRGAKMEEILNYADNKK